MSETEPLNKEPERPIDVNPFFENAQSFVLRINDAIPLTSAILDDWNTREGIHGARIIYGASFVAGCNSKCSECPLFQRVGEDTPQETGINFKTSLCLATDAQLNLFASKQKYLNCKTLAEYQEAYAVYIAEVCTSQELIEAELDWVKGFRLLFLDGKSDISFLREKEKESKSYIVENALEKLRAKFDLQRTQIISEYWYKAD